MSIMVAKSIARPWRLANSIDAQLSRGQIELRGPRPPFSLFPILVVHALRFFWVVTTETNATWLRSELALDGFIGLGGDRLTSKWQAHRVWLQIPISIVLMVEVVDAFLLRWESQHFALASSVLPLAVHSEKEPN